MVLNYKLSRLFYDLHTDRALAMKYRSDRDVIIEQYQLLGSIAQALREDDVAALATLTNGFLLRYYFLVVGMSDEKFIAGLRAGGAQTDG